MGFEKNPFRQRQTDKDGNPVDRRGNKIDVAEHDVPMYRAYGKHKVLRPWLIKFNDLLARFLLILFYFCYTLPALILITFCILYADVFQFAAVILIFLSVIALVLIYIYWFRIPRKRSKFCRKLKRACKKNGYKVVYERGFFKSLTWSEKDDVDYTIKAGEWTYYVKLFGAKNVKSDVTFCHDGTLIYRKLRIKNVFTLVFNMQTRTKVRKVCFPSVLDDKKTVKAIILNPVPMEMYKRRGSGDTDMSGNDDTMFGYTVFTGSGFIEAMRRNAENDVREQKEALH